MADDECDMCGQPASAQTLIDIGDNWHDAVGKPPYSLFETYTMICRAGMENGKMKVFLHTEMDLQSGGM